MKHNNYTSQVWNKGGVAQIVSAILATHISQPPLKKSRKSF